MNKLNNCHCLDHTLNDIRLKLANADAQDAAQGKIIQHEVSPSVFIQLGLELEEHQWVLPMNDSNNVY